MKKIIIDIVDDGHFLECSKGFAKNIITGFASVGGIKTGIIANQPEVLAGVLDINSSCKAARFIRFCDAFDIPILTLRRCSRISTGYCSRTWGDHQTRF